MNNLLIFYIAIPFIFLLAFILFNKENRGQRGERLTEKRLDQAFFLGLKGKTLTNIYIPKGYGETTEIDLLYITEVGIFVIESKNYSGWIFGSDKNQKWTEVVFSEKHQFYNPILQNEAHMKWLSNYLKEDIRMFSLIVFSDECEFKSLDLSSTPNNVFVCTRKDVIQIIGVCFRRYKPTLSEAKIESIYNRLYKYTDVKEETINKHIQDIKNSETNLVCPLCGKKLVVRTARKGYNAGKKFYGCSGYPECTYIRDI